MWEPWFIRILRIILYQNFLRIFACCLRVLRVLLQVFKAVLAFFAPTSVELLRALNALQAITNDVSTVHHFAIASAVVLLVVRVSLAYLEDQTLEAVVISTFDVDRDDFTLDLLLAFIIHILPLCEQLLSTGHLVSLYLAWLREALEELLEDI